SMRTFLYVTLIMGLIINLNYIIGLAARVFIPDQVVDADYATIQMAIEFLPPVVAAILMVGILSAVMSTLDSLLMIVGTSISEDIYRKTLKPNTSEKQVIKITQISIVVVTIIVMILTI